MIEPSELARLREGGGVDTVFLEVGRWQPGSAEVQRQETGSLPSGTRVVLVLRGKKELPRAEQAAELAASVRQLRFQVEADGLVPVGLHWDVPDGTSLSGLAELMEALKSELDTDLFLSLTVHRKWIARESLRDVARHVDVLVPFIYGQRVQEKEEAEAWDFQTLEQSLGQLEELGQPYLLGLVTLGTATHMSTRGRVLARTTRASLPEILWNRNLKLRLGFSLEGANRRVYTVSAERATEAGPWKLNSGEQVRIVRPVSSDLEELLRLLGAWNLQHHLGQVYHRIPNDEEQLSLTLGNLINVFDPAPATPDLELTARVQRRTGRGWLMRFSITNRNGETTSLSLVDSNYLEVKLTGGTFSRVQLGDFYRFDLFRSREGQEPERTFRQADIMRLHVALLDGRQTVSSGDVQILGRSTPEMEIRSAMLLNDGRTLEVGPEIWRAGERISGPATVADEEEGEGEGEDGAGSGDR